MSLTRLIIVTSVIGLLLFGGAGTLAAKEITATDFSNSRSYSSAVSAEGGKIVWLAGEAYLRMNRQVARRRLRGANASDLWFHRKDLGTTSGKVVRHRYMTVYITDARYGDKFVEIRKEIFKQRLSR